MGCESRSSEGDSATLPETLTMAVEQVEAVQEAEQESEVVTTGGTSAS